MKPKVGKVYYVPYSIKEFVLVLEASTMGARLLVLTGENKGDTWLVYKNGSIFTYLLENPVEP